MIPVEEKILLTDGSIVTAKARTIGTLEAHKVVEEAFKVTDMSEETYDFTLPNGQIERRTRPALKGNFSGIFSLPIKAIRECLIEFTQINEIDPDDVQRIYGIYAKPVIEKILRSTFSPK